MKNVLIIAEAGVNHNGDIQIAKNLIKSAISAGADAVKFQAAIPEFVVTELAQKACYQSQSMNAKETQLDMIRKLLLPNEVLKDLQSFCMSKDIVFFSTAFDLVSLDFLESLGPPYHKIPSGEITNLPYLRQIGRYRRPIILSTGMASLGEIEAAIEVLNNSGINREKITVLHCTTEYPAPPGEVNLRAMQSMGHALGVKVGYSDHTEGIEVAIAAVAMGATIIEKHLTLDRNLPGPDHKASLEPDEFAAMVRGIRTIEQALGDGIKRPTASEKANSPVVRKSLVAGRPIRAGELFSEANLTAKRPGTGVSPMLWDEWIGRPAHRDFATDELIE